MGQLREYFINVILQSQAPPYITQKMVYALYNVHINCFMTNSCTSSKFAIQHLSDFNVFVLLLNDILIEL